MIKKPVYLQKNYEIWKRQNQGKKGNFRDIVAKGIRYKAEIKTIDKKSSKITFQKLKRLQKNQ